MELFVIIVVFAGIAIVIRLVAGTIDADRIESYVRERGWTLLDRSWDPLGPGWFGEKNARIYQIVYRDCQGNIHRAHVKTSMLSGVYLTNDHVVEPAGKTMAEPNAADEDLRQENERLRKRIQELERKKT